MSYTVCCQLSFVMVLLATYLCIAIKPAKNVVDAAGQFDLCPKLQPPTNGRLIVKAYHDGKMAQVLCHRGYHLLGEKSWLQCNKTEGTWSAPVPSCRDINECNGIQVPGRRRLCSPNADCINLLGNYACICRPGYHGNGMRKCLPSFANFLRRGDTCGTVSAKVSNASTLRHRRIVGGRQAMPGSWPWQVMLHLRKKGIPSAGGALVDKRWVVTLASVLHSGTRQLATNEVKIVLGDYDRRKRDFQETEYKAQRIILYPGFDRRTLDKDIALIQLDRDVTMGTYINKVCLVSGRKSKWYVKSSRIATVSGWGTTRPVKIGGKPGDFSDVLKEVNLPLVANRKCQQATAYTFNPRSQMCAGFYADRKSPCYGDAGSPLVTLDPDSGRWVLIGLFSWSEGCGQKRKFSYYTRVAKFRRWIVHNIKNS